MRKLKLIKVIGSLLIATSVLALNPIGASAEWRQDDKGWWYADGSSWSIGRKRIGEHVYYFDANGYMSTGWKEINGKWNYFDDNGCQKTGWMQYGGKWYCMAPDGAMLTNTAVNGWYLNNEGIGTKCIDIGGFEIDKATGTIVRYKGNDTSLVIPSELGGIEIKSIGFMAFDSCDKLTSITIPSSVTDIGFLNCKSLTSIIVDDNNKNYTSVDGVLFNKSKTELVKCPQGRRNTGYIIPDSVTSIRRQAFYNCIGLTSITISDKVTSIGETAFYNCSGLTNITIPDSVTNIGGGAFDGCTGLTSITIPNKVTSIEETTFYNCSSLTNITIPDSVTNIGVGAFAGCTSLTSITIPDSVTSIETKNKRGPYIANPFYNCTNVMIYVNSEKTKQLLVNSSVNKSVIILNGQSSALNQNASANINNVSTKVNENGNEQIVTFSDKNLEQIVRNKINKYTGDLYKSDVEKITSLVASDKQIADISGIENLNNLEELYLTANNISDISKLKGLTNLQLLCLNINKISDISALKELTNLNTLDLNFNKINDISDLKGLTNLQKLDLIAVKISDTDKKTLENALPNCKINFGK